MEKPSASRGSRSQQRSPSAVTHLPCFCGVRWSELKGCYRCAVIPGFTLQMWAAGRRERACWLQLRINTMSALSVGTDAEGSAGPVCSAGSPRFISKIAVRCCNNIAITLLQIVMMRKMLVVAPLIWPCLLICWTWLDPGSGAARTMQSTQAPGMGTNFTDGLPWESGLADLTWSSTASCVVKMVLISIIVCVSLFGNVVVLLVFQRKPQLLHVANRFVLNLLLADLLQTILVMPFAMAATVPSVWPLDVRLCQALVVLMHLFAFTGVNTIIVVSIDRYLAIIHPLSYPTRMTPHLGTNLIICTWVLSFLQSTPPLYGWGAIVFDRHHNMCSVVWSFSLSYSVVVSSFSFWLPVLIMLGCYWMVFRAARRQNALVHPIQSQSYSQPSPQDFQGQSSPHRQPHGPTAGSPGGQYSTRGYPVRVRHRRFHYHCKAARVVFVIMASYVLSMGPYSILNTISMSPRASIPSWLSSVALVLFFLQCCLHPYIYGYMHRSVRKEFLALLCGLFCKQSRPRQSSAVESCFTTTEGRSAAHHHLPSLAARVLPLRTWEECTTSSSPTFERKSRDSRKDTTSTSISSERELTVNSKHSSWARCSINPTDRCLTMMNGSNVCLVNVPLVLRYVVVYNRDRSKKNVVIFFISEN